MVMMPCTGHSRIKVHFAATFSITFVSTFQNDDYTFFFLKFLADTCPFWGPLVPLFWISGDVSSGFQSQSGFCLIRYFCGGKCNVHSPRFTSGVTLADFLAAGTQPVTSPHACAEVGTWLRFERATARTEDERATIVSATRLMMTTLFFCF